MKARSDLLTFASSIDIPGVPATGRNAIATVDADPDNVKTFTKITTPFAAHHRVWLAALQRVADGSIKRLMGCMPPGSAKALALDTPIPTPSGWSTMGELQVGDEVFNEHGRPCRVTWVSPVWLDRPVHAVTVETDGATDVILADAEHLWQVRGELQPVQTELASEICTGG